MEMIHTNTKKFENYQVLKEMAFSESAPEEVNKALLKFINEPSEKCSFTFNDIHNFYVDFWHHLSMNEKMNKASDFKKIHNWIKEIGFKYRLNARDTIDVIGHDICWTCRGSGLYVIPKKYYHLVLCPDCNGTAKKGKSFCKTCAIQSPFGLTRGSGKVMIESETSVATVICHKCSGMGVRNAK